MTALNGTLTISTRGAQLQCPLGCFVVDDKRLSGITYGKHRGFFDLQKILPHATRNTHGQLQFALLAVVKQFALETSTSSVNQTEVSQDAKGQQQQLSLFSKTDRLEDILSIADVPNPPLPALTDSPTTQEKETDNETGEAETAAVRKITQPSAFAAADHAYPSDLPKTVTLDSTLTREQLRREVQFLKASGYAFDCQTQQWQLSA